jgi:signal transduction histidine kinase
MGLGLAISAELIRGHGGTLELVRSDSDGSEFLIRLPKDGEPVDVSGAS